MTTKRCQKCKHFNGYDGVGDLWTLCSLGDFIGTKTDCQCFEKKVTKADLLKKIRELERENEKLKEEEKLYAQEILRLNTLLKQYQSFKDLGGDY